MSDIRDVLAQIAAEAIYTQAWGQPPSNDEERWAWRADAFAAVDAILATYLTIPRSDIVGTEYGWRYSEAGQQARTWIAPDRDIATREAYWLRSRQIEMGRVPDAEPLSRPVLPWSVIPLPEEGEQ